MRRSLPCFDRCRHGVTEKKKGLLTPHLAGVMTNLKRSSTVSFSSDTAWRGSVTGRRSVPFRTRTRSGARSGCSFPPFSSCAYCAAVGVCGEPIFFHSSYELL